MVEDDLDIHDLVKGIELVGIKYRGIGGDIRVPDTALTETEVQIDVQEQHDEEHLEVRFLAKIETQEAEYRCQVSTHYVGLDFTVYSQAVITDFIERVAVMAAFPYIREAVASTAARLELDVPMLGILRLGEFHVAQASEPAHTP